MCKGTEGLAHSLPALRILVPTALCTAEGPLINDVASKLSNLKS